MAETQEITVCTGSKEGAYYPAVEHIRQHAEPELIVTALETKGSVDNLKGLEDQICQAAIIQADAYFLAQTQMIELSVERTAELYDEYVHLICNRQAGIDQINDLKENSQNNTLLIGTKGSGAALTWEAFVALDSDYGRIPTLPFGGERALTQLIEGQNSQCMLIISGLRSKMMREIDQHGDILKLVHVSNSNFKDKKDGRGDSIYRFQKIPSGTYEQLQRRFFGGIETIIVSAVLVTNRHWIDQNPLAYQQFAKAVLAARPYILEMMATF
ncbi:hypothetical protein TPSD3_02395 [Thioflexithrix psekupsensis]|uniref:Uncharacterized protein n=2 Tax=Thioflexithrix psekupsensis TaxID=1570016 RepID=A0A251XAR8_9GAMM|nr:hypothetical protein TPSD3_02395 [Thioflexithrix psekupsensis]